MLTVNRDKFLKGEGLQLMNLMLRLEINLFSIENKALIKILIAEKRNSREMDH